MLLRVVAILLAAASVAAGQSPRKAVALIVTGGTVVTVDGSGRVLSPGAVAIDGRDIVGEVRDRAGNLIDDGRHLVGEARDRAGNLISDGRDLARHDRKRGTTYGRRAVRYADDNRTSTLLGLAAVAFAVGWLSRSKH